MAKNNRKTVRRVQKKRPAKRKNKKTSRNRKGQKQKKVTRKQVKRKKTCKKVNRKKTSRKSRGQGLARERVSYRGSTRYKEGPDVDAGHKQANERIDELREEAAREEAAKKEAAKKEAAKKEEHKKEVFDMMAKQPFGSKPSRMKRVKHYLKNTVRSSLRVPR